MAGQLSLCSRAPCSLARHSSSEGFRHLPGGAEDAARLDPETLDRHQDRLQRALEVSGEGWVSTTKLRGRTYLRAGVVNYLSSEGDVDLLLGALRRLSASAR